MFNRFVLYLNENPTLRYWIIRPEWVAVILLVISIIASIQLSPFFADMAFIMDSATPYVEYGLIAIILTLVIISGEIDLSIASMIFGAVAAIGQTNLKRLVAYSSIGHMGYALAGIATGSQQGIESTISYLSIYLVMNLGLFCCLFMMRRKNIF